MQTYKGEQMNKLKKILAWMVLFNIVAFVLTVLSVATNGNGAIIKGVKTGYFYAGMVAVFSVSATWSAGVLLK